MPEYLCTDSIEEIRNIGEAERILTTGTKAAAEAFAAGHFDPADPWSRLRVYVRAVDETAVYSYDVEVDWEPVFYGVPVSEFDIEVDP